jgi:hypothetical protein
MKNSTKLPSEFETKPTEFQHFVIGLQQRIKYSLHQIGNAYKTAVLLYMPCNYTINFKGEKQVAIKTTGYKKLRVPAMLCITTKFNKLPPHIILNKKAVPEENFCKDVILWPQKNYGCHQS